MEVLDLGIKGYAYTFDIQLGLLNRRINNKTEDMLILVEHFPVVTTGRLKGEESIIDIDYFKERGIPVIKTNRGGGVTFHSPGQLVLYPIVALSRREKNISSFIDFLEITVANSLKILGLPVERAEGRRGVWLDNKKIAFTGVAFKKWVSYHGISVNINNDTAPFLNMYPCGEKGIDVISLKEYSKGGKDMSEVKKIFARQFQSDFNEKYREQGSVKYLSV